MIKNIYDLKLISKKTKLDIQRASVLTEEDKDTNLILNEISDKIKDKELENITFPTYCKIMVFKLSKNKDLPVEDKAYVSKIIYENKDNTKLPKIDSANLSSCEKAVCYYCLSDKTVSFSENEWYRIKCGFRENNKDGENIVSFWVPLIKGNKGIFSKK